jgi:hypothetical protein
MLMLVAAFGAAAVIIFSKAHEPPPVVANSRPITEATLEQMFGVRLDLIGVSAGGGMIDFRFTILDPDKAAPLFGAAPEDASETTHLHENAVLPVLVAEDSETVVEARGSMAHHKVGLSPGTTYFILYPNPDGAIQGGTSVSVVIGGVRVEHVMARI